MDADTLRAPPDFSDVSFLTGIASGDINLDLLDLDQSTRDALAQLQQLDAAAGVSTPLEVNIAKAVHHVKKPGKRRRLRRAGSSSESSPSPSSDSEDSKRPHPKPSGGTKAALAAAGLADVPGIASDPIPSKRCGLRMPKAWRKTKSAKKRRAASGSIAVPPKDRPAFKSTDPRLRDSPAAPAVPSSLSPSLIVPSVAAPASGPSLVVTQGPAQASLSTGDSHGARTVSPPAPTGVSIVARRVASPGEGSARRTSSVTGSGTVAGTSVKVGLRLYPSSMFPVPSHAAASSSFKSSLLAEQESASNSDVLGLESEVVEVSSGDEGLRSSTAPSSGDVEEKTEDVIVDSPVQEVPSSQPSGNVLSLTPGSGPVIRPSSEASPAAGPIPAPSQVPLQTPSDTSAAPLTHSRSGVVIVSTFTPGFDPRSTIPSSDIPVPVHGVQPIVRSSANLPSSTNPIVDLRFHMRAAQRCWFAIICARVPTPIGDQAVAPCSIEGIVAFANFADANHPFQAYLRSLPDRSSIFDSSVLDIDMVISRRAPLTLRYFHLWRRLRGQTSNTTLAIALWERHHWVANSAVERMIRAMFRDPSFNKEVVKAILQQWKEYIKFRKQRADVLWIHHKRSFQGEWLVDEQDKAEGVKDLPPELIFEPSVPAMSFENLPWVPFSDDWISSVMALDAAEPWRNCWMEQPHRHPFSTIFMPCNPTVCIFVPHGQTPQSVGPSIVIDDCVAPREVAAGWDRDWNRPPVAHEASQGAASGASSAAATTTSTRDTPQASSLGLMASAAATSTSTGTTPTSASVVSTTTEI
ncbi:hypothetical protein PC121_g16607 [Phytophthora cactorum]|nr:hypothetical protein PC120_g15753 [Phytophthora cactorum]KAG3053788.1 hypothetical protein PC121_g16607 [Phytophthora cactorum]